MLYLYLGFLIGQSFPVFKTLYNAGLPPLAVAFSIAVFLIWTFVPTLGYLAARLTGAKPQYKGATLFVLGLVVCMFEKILFHFDILKPSDGFLPFIISAIIFFAIAYIPNNRFLPFHANINRVG
jgi:hypothetical protein